MGENFDSAGPVVGALLGALALLGSGIFASKATRAAARMTSEAQRAAAQASVEPAQRRADLDAFKEIRDGLERKLDRQEERIDSLTTLVRAFSGYVTDLTGQMRDQGMTPPEAPERVEQYNRTGV